MQRRIRSGRGSYDLRKFISPTEEIDKINKLKIERELKELENKEIIGGLEENRLNLSKLISSFKEIEKEHYNRIDKANAEYAELLNAIDEKNKELDGLNYRIIDLLKIEQRLNNIIPELSNEKQRLEIELKDTVDRLNFNKNNSEIYLSNIRKNIDDERITHKDLIEKIGKAKAELRTTIDLIKEENAVLSKRQRDLEIYEVRLKKKYPNDKITL